MSETIVELGLSRPDLDRRQLLVAATDLADRLLELLAEGTIESELLEVSDFRTNVAQYRARLSTEVDPRLFAREADGCADFCEKSVSNARRLFVDRDSEIREVIGLLAKAIDALAGDSDTFHARLRRPRRGRARRSVRWRMSGAR